MTLKTKHLSSEFTRLAQGAAVEHYILQDADSTMPYEMIYELAQTEDFDDAGLEPTEPYEHDDHDDIARRMREMASDTVSVLKSYRDSIAKGMQMFAVCDRALSNNLVFDVDSFARLGRLIYATVEVDGEPFKLNSATGKWVGVNDKSLVHDIDFSANGSFMPDTFGQKVLIEGINGELRYIVDQTNPYEDNLSM